MKTWQLDSLVKKFSIEKIGILKLDVEGHEYEVLLSYNFDIQIDVILIEMLGVQPDKDELCRQRLINNGYIFDQKFAHNEIFISSQFKSSRL